MAVAMALVALLKAAELALLTDCTLPPWELATALATALVFVGLANGCMHACMHAVALVLRRHVNKYAHTSYAVHRKKGMCRRLCNPMRLVIYLFSSVPTLSSVPICISLAMLEDFVHKAV